jgi:hypothetical protein
MKKIFLVLLFFLISFSNVAKSQTVELKDFQLGMTKKEFKKNWKKHRVKVRQSITSLLLPHYTVTLAGVNVDKPVIWWKDKKASTIQFRFYFHVDAVKPLPCSDIESCNSLIQPASNFVRVVEAVKKKYPGFKCSETELMNKMGATWKKRKCIYHHGDGVSISTIRYRNNDEWGTITILPTANYEQGQKENIEEFNSDL